MGLLKVRFKHCWEAKKGCHYIMRGVVLLAEIHGIRAGLHEEESERRFMTSLNFQLMHFQSCPQNAKT